MKKLHFLLSMTAVMGAFLCSHAQVYINHTHTQNPLLVANAGINQTLCPGDTALLGGSPAAIGGDGTYTYLWSPGTNLSDSTVGNPTAYPSTTTTHTMLVTDNNNCTASSTVSLTVVNPVAAYSFVTNMLTADFTDLSNPATSWLWTFGDGTTSTVQNPQHVYGSPGTYIVCLTVNGGTNCQATTCDTITVVAIGVDPAFAGVGLKVYPNPATGSTVAFAIEGGSLVGSLQISLTDISGRVVRQINGDASLPVHELQRGSLSSGAYLYQVTVDGRLLGMGKLVLE